MNHKERVDAALAFQPVDRTPFCLVDGGAWIAKTENLPYRKLYGLEDGGASKIVKWTDEVDTDIVSAVSGVFTACLNAFGCPIHIDVPGRPTETGAVTTALRMASTHAGIDAFGTSLAVLTAQRGSVPPVTRTVEVTVLTGASIS